MGMTLTSASNTTSLMMVSVLVFLLSVSGPGGLFSVVLYCILLFASFYFFDV